MPFLRPLAILCIAHAVLTAGAFAQNAPNGAAGSSAGGGAGRPLSPAPVESSPAATARPGAAETPRAEAAPEIVFLPGPDGKPVPIVKDATLQEYLDWKRKRSERGGAELRFSVASVAFDGDVDEERAQLTAIVRVQVYDDEWVAVPLQLNEAVLRDVSYKGAGDHSFAGVDRELGHRWWLRGKGDHELTLSLGAPVRRQGPSRRLQLTLPPTAVSSLVLRIPVQATSTKVLPDTAWIRTQSEGGRSTVEVRGLGARFDLSWQPLAASESAETILQVESSLDATITGDSVVLVADQAIEAMQGSFQEIRVRLPEGFELLDVEDRQGKLSSWTQPDPDQPALVTLKFVEPSKGPIGLHWTLESQFPETGGLLTLHGFEVERALRQSGEIMLSAADGYRVTRREGEDRFVYRSQSRRIPANGRNATSWRFLKQPFRLVVDVKESEPFFTVEPRLNLHFASDHAELSAVFKYNVATDRGAVRDVTLAWPGWKQEGWVILPVDAPGLVEQMQTDDSDPAGLVRFRLVSRKVGSFELPIKAVRPVTSDAESFPFSLPTAVAAGRTPMTVNVGCDANLEADIRLAKPATAADEPPQWAREWTLRPETPSPSFVGRLMAHPQRVRCDATVDCEVALVDRLQVVQRLQYDVAYEALAQIRLMAPTTLEGRVAATLDDGTVLPMNSTGVEMGSRRQYRVSLPAARLGRFGLTLTFAVPLPAEFASSGTAAVPLPILQASDAEFGSLVVRFRRSEDGEASIRDAAFQSRLPEDDWSVWIAAGNRAEAPLELSRSFAALSSTYSVPRAWIRTVVDANGRAASHGWFEIEGTPQTIVVRIPAGLAASTFRWDGRRLATDRVRDTGEGGREFRLAVPGVLEPAHHVLAIDFQSIEGNPLHWGQSNRFDSPRFPEAVWVQQTAWELVLPEGQHLLGTPSGYTPQQMRAWNRLLWERRVPPAFDGPQRWIAGIEREAAASDADPQRRSTYVFTRLGAAESIEASTVSSPMLVLLGAGIAWGAGILLLKVPVTRSVVSVLSIGLVLALVGLRNAAALELLVQPAAIGLLLALAMFAIERLVSRDRAPAVLTLPPVSNDAVPAAPSSLHRIGLQAPPSGQPLASTGSLAGDGAGAPSRASDREILAAGVVGGAR